MKQKVEVLIELTFDVDNPFSRNELETLRGRCVLALIDQANNTCEGLCPVYGFTDKVKVLYCKEVA